jgi:SAM-dependent methyltransferase
MYRTSELLRERRVAVGSTPTSSGAPPDRNGRPGKYGVFVDPDEATRNIARAALDRGDPTGWFEELYTAADGGAAVVPWDRDKPQAVIAEWIADRPGRGRSALVVGCGLGRDAELVAAHGYATTAFDISATAIAMARRRHPGTTVTYVTADVLDLPEEWRHAYDLVVESITVQSLPPELHARASGHIGGCVAPGGTLLVVSGVAEGDTEGPPWPLTRAEIDGFAVDGLQPVGVEQRDGRWVAEFRR